MTAIHVAQQGVTWGSILISIVSGGGLGAVFIAVIKNRAPMRELAIKSDEKLRASEEKLRKDLMDQLSKQEADHFARVTSLESRIDEQRETYESRIELERVLHANDISTMRHRMNNLDQCLTMLLALIEENPEKAQAAAKRVREMRAKQEASEVAEKATLAAAKVVASATVAAPKPAKPSKGKP
ncbi:hypothetical protein EWE75_18680 [Sphingomonas populi]|uniref:Uncharacterized protein n=1 Tax=Sphingomonas populi TaxID=2484750 RepID=A0A4V2DCE6_9SPHN|nr:hypothetical protein [Sphingomonas populi]RZF61218.1 hypothetical protein EWE75_18680 [Sphingomonas populi]